MKPADDRRLWRRLEGLKGSHKNIGKRVRKLERSTLRHAKRFVTSRLDRLANVRRVAIGWIILIGLLAGISFLQWYTFRDAFMVNGAARGGSYSEGVLGPLETLNPIFARTSAEKSAAKLMFASLYVYDETGSIKPDLARSAVISDDQTEYTISLEKNLKWSDGAPITAKDVAFTVSLLKNPLVRPEITGWSSFKAEALDAQRIKFTLPSAYAPFFHALTLLPILPEHALSGIDPAELQEAGFGNQPITSGPFAFRLLQSTSLDGSEKVLHMVANPNYHRGQAKLDRFQLHAYSSREDIEKALRTSEISATPELSVEASSKISNMYRDSAFTINDGVFAIFNTKSATLANGEIRKALALSVDRQQLVRELSKPAVPLETPVLPLHVADLPRADVYDNKKAAALLESDGWRMDSGVRKKDGQELALRLVAIRGSDFSQTADALAKAWRTNLGIKVDVQMIDPLDTSQDVVQSILQPRSFDVLVYELVIGGDPDVYAYWHSSQANTNGLNFANYANDITDDALSSGRSKLNDKLRADRYRSFSKRWLQDVPAVALYQPKLSYIYKGSASTIEEDTVLVSPEDRFYNVIYWAVRKSEVHRTP